MRNEKKVTIGDREITVYELRVKDIRMFMNKASSTSEGGFGEAAELLPLVTNLKPQDMDEFSLSDLVRLWEAFKEINAVFFDMAAKLGIGQILADTIQKSLTESFAASSKKDT